jgi:hypothetical protein
MYAFRLRCAGMYAFHGMRLSRHRPFGLYVHRLIGRDLFAMSPKCYRVLTLSIFLPYVRY